MQGFGWRIRNPILFRYSKAGRLAYGYEATILADICDAVLAARTKGNVLAPNQVRIAEQCELLVRGFARVGIITLIDEATGYQRDRTRDALARILEAFIDRELQPWLRTFPPAFYQEMFRLRGLEYRADSVRRPPYFGHLTNDIVYDRLAPSILEELKLRIPRNEEGRPTARFSQLVTRNVGWSNLDSHELRLLLDRRFLGLGQQSQADNPNNLYLPEAGSACRLILTFRDGDIAAVKQGQAFNEAELRSISDEIENGILTGTAKVGRGYSFSSMRVTGFWRGAQSGVQILPPGTAAPEAANDIRSPAIHTRVPNRRGTRRPITNYPLPTDARASSTDPSAQYSAHRPDRSRAPPNQIFLDLYPERGVPMASGGFLRAAGCVLR